MFYFESKSLINVLKSQFTINCEQHCFDLFTSARKNIASSNIYNSKSTALLNYYLIL